MAIPWAYEYKFVTSINLSALSAYEKVEAIKARILAAGLGIKAFTVGTDYGWFPIAAAQPATIVLWSNLSREETSEIMWNAILDESPNYWSAAGDSAGEFYEEVVVPTAKEFGSTMSIIGIVVAVGFAVYLAAKLK